VLFRDKYSCKNYTFSILVGEQCIITFDVEHYFTGKTKQSGEILMTQPCQCNYSQKEKSKFQIIRFIDPAFSETETSSFIYSGYLIFICRNC
jgi:hypothetical protein